MTKLSPYRVLKQEQLEAIGCIAVIAAQLEDRLERSIWAMMGIPDSEGKALIVNPMIDKSCDLLRDLSKFKIKDSNKRKRFQDIICRIKHLNQERNIAIHGIWIPFLNKPAVAYKSRRHGKPATMSADKIIGKAFMLEDLSKELHEFAIEVWPRYSEI